MRVGENTSKDQFINLESCSHRIIIPLFIPYERDYYKDSYSIFEMCLYSIRLTSQSPVKISVISNGSCRSVNKKLIKLQNQGDIDELIIEREAIGKVNSILKALRTAEERLITITDADVLFLNGWERAVLEIFEEFPRAGMVSPLPLFRYHFKLTSNIWIRYLFSKKLFFRQVKNPEALTKFAQSIGWSRLDNKYKDIIATLKSSNGSLAVLGATHMTATFKNEVFKFMPSINSCYKLGGDSEYLYLDKPVVKCNAYRLSTYNNFVYHMGNIKEEWFTKLYNELKEEPSINSDFTNIKIAHQNYYIYTISNLILKLIVLFKPLKVILLKFKGVTGEKIKNFT